MVSYLSMCKDDDTLDFSGNPTYIYHVPPELAGYVTLVLWYSRYSVKKLLCRHLYNAYLRLSISHSIPTSLISAHLQKKLNRIMMNAIHSVTKYVWLMYNISIKDLIVSFLVLFMVQHSPLDLSCFQQHVF